MSTIVERIAPTKAAVGSMPVSPQLFARYEFKYLLGSLLCQRIEKEVIHFMDYDGFSHPEFDNKYPVRSLYFDNLLSSNYYEKTDGIKTRRKFRIRTYADQKDTISPIFLEAKGRHNERTYKTRIEIRSEHIPLFTHSTNYSGLISLYEGSDLIESFVYEKIRKRVKPVVLVDYMRRPYTSPFDTNFRLTFDGQLTAIACDMLFPNQPLRKFQCVPGYTILEVKFNRRIPAWFHRIIQAYDLRRLSISKFCKGMEYCSLAEDLS